MHVEALVYDALGRRVAVLHSGSLGAGLHALELPTVGLPSGVYVVHVLAERPDGTTRVAVRRFTVAR